ncbi:MAG TPA: EamA family transporter [Luteitalea sp.]|nr:EamA family transporter [Luteitalea sp.]
MSAGTRRLAWVAFFAVCFFWGTTYLGIKVALETVPPFLLGGIRFTLAGTVLALVLRAMGRPWPAWNRAPVFLLVGFTMLGFGNGGVVWAEQFMASGLVAVLVASTPFWMVGIAAASGGDRLTRRTVAGLLVGFSGILLLVWPDMVKALSATSGWRWIAGLIATQLACIGWAVGSTISKKRLHDIDPLVSSAFQMLAGGLVLLTVSGLTGEFGHLSWTGRTFAAVVYLFFAGSLIGFVAYTYALAHLPISIVSLYPYVNPVVAVLLGTWLLHEPLSWRIAGAIAIILAGSAVVSRGAKPKSVTAGPSRIGGTAKVEAA